ncbi:MAG: T9SS type A sorting domain-containing protein [Chitinophagales bacterium]|nr:T9SS type A sorting domain-containing protein [Chitinophagales bacterium]MDW8428612.1 T9SS type A sorting domain-containing protein [Chitinophagales bacterium]
MSRLFILLIILSCSRSDGQVPPQIEWQRCYGGTDDDIGYAISTTTDGGFIFAGCAGSINGDIPPKTEEVLHGGKCDYWTAHVNHKGDILFKRLLDGTESDVARKALELPDGNFLIAGSTASNDIDVDCNHGDFDVWIIKLDAAGNVLWKKCYGGPGYEDFGSLVLTADGGFAFCAGTTSNSGQVSGNFGSSDFWVVKADSAGNIQWAKCFGGSGYEKAFSLTATSDGGLAICGFTSSQDGQVIGNHSSDFDGWVVRLDDKGKTKWTRCYGGTLFETLYSITELKDGSLMLTGYASSSDGDLTGNYGGDDGWLLRIAADGQILWSKNIGGTADESLSKAIQTADGTIIATGYSRSSGGDVPANYGDWDCWLVLTDTAGNLLHSKNFGGLLADVCYDVAVAADGGLALMGYTASVDTFFDVSGNHGKKDFWLVKLSSLTAVPAFPGKAAVILEPNPAHHYVTIRLPTHHGRTQIRLYDLLGRVLIEETTHQSVHLLLLKTLPSGLYQLSVVQGTTTYSSMLMKQ